MTNKQLLKEDKERTKRELLNEQAQLKARLSRLTEELNALENAIPFTNLEKPFNKLTINEQNAIYQMDRAIYEWFVVPTPILNTSLTEDNTHKSIQDYIDEGEPAGAIRWYKPSLTKGRG